MVIISVPHCDFHFIRRKADIFMCTIRSDRGLLLPSFTIAKLKRGEITYLQSKNLLAAHWYGRRDVFVISNIHWIGSVKIQRHGHKDPIRKPTMTNEHNTFIGGIDRCG